MYFAEFLIGVSAGCILLEFSKKRSFVTLSHPPIRGGGGGGAAGKTFPQKGTQPRWEGGPKFTLRGAASPHTAPCADNGGRKSAKHKPGAPPPHHTPSTHSAKYTPQAPRAHTSSRQPGKHNPQAPPAETPSKHAAKHPPHAPFADTHSRHPAKHTLRAPPAPVAPVGCILLNACWVRLQGMPVGWILLNACWVCVRGAHMGPMLLHDC